VNLFIASAANIKFNTNTSVALSQQTNYPWNGNIKLLINPSKKTAFSVCLRIPGWVRNQPVPSNLYAYVNPVAESIVIKVNGKIEAYRTENGYAVVDREWKKGDEIEYVLPLNVHRVEANSNVEADRNKVALERGPIVYCMEGVDNGNMLMNMVLPDDAVLSAGFELNKLNGIGNLTGEGIVFKPSEDGLSVLSQKKPFVAIPYYSWCNRGITQMQVWLPRKVALINVE
jgi:DUF1680 family protein